MNNNRLYYSNNRGKRVTWGFNCWGATAFVLNLVDRLQWLQDWQMEDILHDYTKVVNENEIKRGDILVMCYMSGTLKHTAVYLGRGKYFHKRGSNFSEITDMNGICRVYSDENIEYRRVVKTTMKYC